MARKKKQGAGSAPIAVNGAGSAPQENALAQEAALQLKADGGSTSASKASRKGAAHAQSVGNVRRSTLYFSVGIALVAGVYLGTLLPGAMRTMNVSQQRTESMQAPAAAEQATVSADITKHILELEQAVLKNSQDLAAWINLGNLYFDTHNHKGAINAYEQALKIKPDNADVLTDLGIMYRDEKMYDQAVAAFQKASQVNPKHQNALFNRGVVLFYDVGRKDEGRAVWRQLLTLNPNAKAPDGKLVRDMVEGR